MLPKKSGRSTVADASQSAAAGIDARASNSIFDSASQTLRLRMHSTIAPSECSGTPPACLQGFSGTSPRPAAKQNDGPGLVTTRRRRVVTH
jgi:hypothetical protein